jgi:hypothetical protein
MPNNPLGPATSDPLGRPPGTKSPNLFAEAPANPYGPAPGNPYGPAPVNPYAPPNPMANYGHFGQPQRMPIDTARAWLLGPAIGMIVGSALGLIFMAFATIGLAADPNGVFDQAPQDPAESAGFYGFLFAYFIGGFLTRLIQIIGAIAMLRVRGYSLAMAGAICAVIPCDVYCCILCLPFGIWGLISLNNAQVKSAFQ